MSELISNEFTMSVSLFKPFARWKMFGMAKLKLESFHLHSILDSNRLGILKTSLRVDDSKCQDCAVNMEKQKNV